MEVCYIFGFTFDKSPLSKNVQMKYKYLWSNSLPILLFGFAVIIGCKESSEEYPLSWEEEKMVAIITDLRVIDNQVKKHNIQDRDSVQSLYKDILYNAHEIDEDELTKNLVLVQRNPKLAKKIEDLVIKRMTTIKDSLDMDDERR